MPLSQLHLLSYKRGRGGGKLGEFSRGGAGVKQAPDSNGKASTVDMTEGDTITDPGILQCQIKEAQTKSQSENLLNEELSRKRQTGDSPAQLIFQ